MEDDPRIRAIAEAWMKHQGYTDDDIAVAETDTHESSGCEFDGNVYSWDCLDEDDNSRHPAWDDLEIAIAMAHVAVEALDSIDGYIHQQTGPSVPDKKIPVSDRIEAARRVVEERGIDLAQHRPALISLAPHLSKSPDDFLDQVLLAEVAILMDLKGPWTPAVLAEQLANSSGAFPWNGPVGNGMTVQQYQDKFTDLARDHVFWAEVLGFKEG